jgi:putative ABC transport system permease protein
VALVVGQGIGIAAVGLVLGLAGSLAVSRLLSGFLYGVTPTDPLTYGAVVALLGGVAALASFVPARRATGVDPVEVLRSE